MASVGLLVSISSLHGLTQTRVPRERFFFSRSLIIITQTQQATIKICPPSGRMVWDSFWARVAVTKNPNAF